MRRCLPYFAALLIIFSPGLSAQTTVAEWQAKAVAAYPALAEKGSAFNEAFIALYQEKKASEPTFLQQADWPWRLASQVAEVSGVAPVEVAPAVPEEAAEVVAEAPAPEVAPAAAAADQSSEWEAKNVSPALGLEFAKFRWWAPGGVPLRGVLVLAPGRGGDGRGMADAARWQAIAREQHFGIVACFLKNRAETPFAYQEDPNGATSKLIDEAVEALAKENGHQGKSMPLFFYGHSAGGNVSQKYGNQNPRRMVGAVIMRCPSGSGKYSPAKGDVPMLIYIGGKDKPEWVKYSKECYEEGMKKRALWTLALHPDEGHGEGNTWALTERFVHGVIESRMGKPGPGSTAAPKKLSRQQGWLGDPDSFEVGSSSQFKGKKAQATWLPDEATALEWQAYLKK